VKVPIFEPKEGIFELKDAIFPLKDLILEPKDAIFEPKDSIRAIKDPIFEPKDSIRAVKDSIFEPKDPIFQTKNCILTTPQTQKKPANTGFSSNILTPPPPLNPPPQKMAWKHVGKSDLFRKVAGLPQHWRVFCARIERQIREDRTIARLTPRPRPCPRVFFNMTT